MNRERGVVRSWPRGPALALILAAGLNATVWGAGGAFSRSAHGSTNTGVSRLPARYSRGECGHCHDAHGGREANATTYPYALFAREEHVCWACHDGSVTRAADAKVPFSTTPPNTSTDYYKHPVARAYSGTTPSAHRAGESSPSAFAGGNRHAECTDCHNPHMAIRERGQGNPGGPNANRLPGALLGAAGLVVTAWQSAGQPFSGASYRWQALISGRSSDEWQVCVKCHSSFTTLPTYTAVGSGDYQATKITSALPKQVREYQDVGQAFNPNNLSYHPVVAAGRNTTIPNGAFASPWSMTSTMGCSDCHTKGLGASGASGPHGSSNLHLLALPIRLRPNTHYRDPSWGANIGQDPNELCFQCHRWQTYVQKDADPVSNTGFRDGAGKNLHTRHMGHNAPGVTCYVCHDVHGTNKEHLINFDLSSVSSNFGSQGAYTHTARGGSCNLRCHGQSHNPTVYSRESGTGLRPLR